MKVLRWFLVLAIAVLVLSVGAFSAGAAGSDPVGAPYVDNATHSIGANLSTWYRFEYAGDHSQILIKLVDAVHDGVDHGLSFQVYTPSQMQDWWKHDGIGAGNVKGDDLIWTGNAHENGTWWIKVTNINPAPMTFNLVVTGDKVSFGPALPVLTVAGVTAPSLNNVDPNNALPADATPRVVPGKSTLWYRFFYTGDHSQVTVRLPMGVDNLLRFHVHTPTQMATWWDITPVGQSNHENSDLVWTGNSHEPGWWYIEVINDNTSAIGFTLQVTGEKVSFVGPTESATVPALPSIGTPLTNADPNNAMIVGADRLVIPGKTTLWYRFAYRGSHDQAILTIPDGAKNLLRVHVHTPQQMTTWWNATPVGQATPHGDDLLWNGSAEEGGWWYIEVMNDNTSAVSFQLLLELHRNNIQ